mmetsp:Transcript_40289/g.93374  ORF Transcript_40289/g.93374 Transcript_40289/m.93374 type:complete len:176 (+) Transcript_40289:804-1331(+)
MARQLHSMIVHTQVEMQEQGTSVAPCATSEWATLATLHGQAEGAAANTEEQSDRMFPVTLLVMWDTRQRAAPGSADLVKSILPGLEGYKHISAPLEMDLRCEETFLQSLLPQPGLHPFRVLKGFQPTGVSLCVDCAEQTAFDDQEAMQAYLLSRRSPLELSSKGPVGKLIAWESV